MMLQLTCSFSRTYCTDVHFFGARRTEATSVACVVKHETMARILGLPFPSICV